MLSFLPAVETVPLTPEVWFDLKEEVPPIA